MKTQIIILIMLINISVSIGQNWSMAKQVGGNNSDAGVAYIDINNNIYCFGDFYGSCYFENDTLYSSGVNDLFLAKYDANGNELWAKRMGGDNSNESFNEDIGKAIIDNANNCLYITGKFRYQMEIDSYSVTSAGSLDYFIAKFDFNGNCQWLKRAGTSIIDFYSMTVNIGNNGNVLWTVALTNSGSIDSINVDEGTYLLEYNSNGNLINYRKVLTGASITKIDFFENEIFILGRRYDTLTIDTITTTKGNNFLAKLDTNYNVQWFSTISGYANDFVTPNDNVYLTGQFENYLIINDSIVFTSTKPDMYLCEFDGTGKLQWSQRSNADGFAGAYGTKIKKDNENKMYICGYFSGNAIFGDFNVNTSNSTDAFVAKYDSNGACEGIYHFGIARAIGIDIDTNGNLLISGDFGFTINLGSTSLTSYSNYADMFFAKCDAITTVGKAKNAVINNQLVIYANPMQGKCKITVPEEFANEKELNLKIYDNTGKQLQNAKLVMIDNKVKIDLNNEAKGIYNVVLSNGKTNYNGKIVFE